MLFVCLGEFWRFFKTVDQCEYTWTEGSHEHMVTRQRNQKSMQELQADFQERFNRRPPTKLAVIKWERKLFSAGSVEDRAGSGRPSTCEEVCHEGEASLLRSPKKSRQANNPQDFGHLRRIDYHSWTIWVRVTRNGDHVPMTTRCSMVYSDWSAVFKYLPNSPKPTKTSNIKKSNFWHKDYIKYSNIWHKHFTEYRNFWRTL
jgi:hypothetical protein